DAARKIEYRFGSDGKLAKNIADHPLATGDVLNHLIDAASKDTETGGDPDLLVRHLRNNPNLTAEHIERLWDNVFEDARANLNPVTLRNVTEPLRKKILSSGAPIPDKLLDVPFLDDDRLRYLEFANLNHGQMSRTID